MLFHRTRRNFPFSRTLERLALSPALVRASLARSSRNAAAPSVLESNRAFEPLRLLTEKNTKRVDRRLLDGSASCAQPIPQILQHIASAGGKRMRARITLAVAQLFGYQGSSHIDLAACVEAIHCASLLHDDVIDESATRRGQIAVNRIWGEKAAVLVGDFLFARAFALMTKHRDFEILQLLSQTALRLTEGEVRQLQEAKALGLDKRVSLEIIRAKTGALFKAAALTGAILAKTSAKHKSAMARFGMDFGIGYQLADDMLDYVGESQRLGKQRGDDLREGKVTYPLLLAVERASKSDRARVQQLFGRAHIEEAAVEEVCALLQRYHALRDCRALAESYLRRAARSVRGLGEPQARHALESACTFALERVS